MPDASDEQAWWSNLFTGGADPGLEIPDGVWESVMTAALEIDVPEYADDLMPADQGEMGFDELDDEPGMYHEFGHPSAHGDAVVHDGGDSIGPELDSASVGEDTYHESSDHEVLYDVAPDDSVVDGPDAIDDQL
ncbi:hypothetical protein [Mycobacterium sp.]|uniref:hypothetical protein n=1 Tax=Mycobacterium sp. TaxID=1785 RepID=UPI002C4AEA37|nr:hypothetical protein [Mycobacterium sp.]HME46944.1 hypothetical protein [Mycobacterium sp.]